MKFTPRLSFLKISMLVVPTGIKRAWYRKFPLSMNKSCYHEFGFLSRATAEKQNSLTRLGEGIHERREERYYALAFSASSPLAFLPNTTRRFLPSTTPAVTNILCTVADVAAPLLSQC